MLEELVKYAETHDLVLPPGLVAMNDIYWYIICDSNGKFLEVYRAGDKKNPPRCFQKCPAPPQAEKRRRGRTSGFLVDTADVVALYKTTDERISKAHETFVTLLCDAGKEAMPVLQKIADMLENPKTLEEIRRRLAEADEPAKSTEKVTFQIDNGFPLDSSAWHSWWLEYREHLKGEKDKETEIESQNLMICLATGNPVKPARTHDTKIKGLGRDEHTLVSFYEDSYTSYGLKDSHNAAVSEETAHAYCTALNELIGKHSHNLAGAKVVHWFKEEIPNEHDLFFLVLSVKQQEREAQNAAKKLLESIEKGEYHSLPENHYYALVLSGGNRRVMVRDWLDGSFKELADNVSQWFDDLTVVNAYGDGTNGYPGIKEVIECLLPPKKEKQKDEKRFKSVGSERIALWRAAVKGAPIPYTVIPRLVHLCGNFFISGKLEDALDSKDKKNKAKRAEVLSLIQTRMGLIKMYHIRKHRKSGEKEMAEEFKPHLNESHPEPSYHLGRLMAVLSRLQYLALGHVGAGVVQRFYAAASTAPALVFGRLIKLSNFHLSSLGKKKHQEFKKKMASIWGRVEDYLPPTLNLEEQSLFALGYYQQLAQEIKEREDSKKQKSTNQNPDEEVDDE